MILPPHPVWTERHHGGCATCRYWQAWESSGAALCNYRGRPLVFAQPQHGCAYWEREPGSDDGLEQ